jgi:hypothetical protein
MTIRISIKVTTESYYRICSSIIFIIFILEINHFDVDLIKLINDDQEMLDNQLHNLKLKQLLRETLEKLRKSNFSINEALEKGSNSDDFI